MSSPAPVLVGVVDDISPAGVRSYEQFIQAGLSSAIESGRVDRPVELIYEHAAGLPSGTAHAVARCIDGLIERGVVAILGPSISDNALAVGHLADRAHVPMLQWSGSEQTRSEWCFQYQAGSLEDEPALLARHSAERGLRRLAVVHDTAATGQRLMAFFDLAARRLGLEIVARQGAPAHGGALSDERVDGLLAAQPDAVVHLGLWSLVPLAERLRDIAPDVVGLANIAASVAQVRTEWLPALEGWTFLGLASDRNPVAARLLAPLGITGPPTTRQIVGLDLGQVLGEAIANAPVLSPAGLRAGLEAVKLIPAAAGHPGTELGFGRWDRAALKGPYLVLQQYRDGRAVTL